MPFKTIYAVAVVAMCDMAILGAFYVASWSQSRSRFGAEFGARVWQTTDAMFCIGLLYMVLATGGYRRSMLTNPYSQISRVLVNATALAALGWIGLRVLTLTDLFDWPVAGPLNAISLGVLLMCLMRLAVNRLLIGGARQGTIVRTVAVVGADIQGRRLIEALQKRKEPWTRVVGIFDDRKNRMPEAVAGQTVDGTVEDLIALARDTTIDEIMIALPWSAEQRLLEIIERLKVIPANVHLAPDVIGHHFLDKGYARVDGVPVFNVLGKPISDWGALLKRAEDLVLGVLISVMVAPVMILCAIAIRINSPGPIFFKQRRYGYNNKLIEVYKFRSMYHHMRDESASRLATQDDPRITPVGRFLRKSSLDELPQLFNVLLGDMSLVGPRPHAVQAKAAGKLYQEVVREYAVRHRVKPGITGWAQVMGWRGETDTEEKIVNRVACDLYYMENWSLFLDIEILFRTFFAVTGKNAY